jgi:hypothetical protein
MGNKLSLSAELQNADLQNTYANYKNTLQQMAQKIGDVEQEAEEHKFVFRLLSVLISTLSPPHLLLGHRDHQVLFFHSRGCH